MLHKDPPKAGTAPDKTAITTMRNKKRWTRNDKETLG
jgi:hypothetical protein